MREIDVLRGKIDRIDDRILELINRRAHLAIQIGKEKSKQSGARGNHFHVPHREREIIERLRVQNRGPFPDSSMETVFREIFSATLALEKPLSIAFLGPETTFSHQAAAGHFGHGAIYKPLSSIDAIFAEVESGEANYGVVPIENSTEGIVNLTLDCFINSPLVIEDEIKLGIALYLLSAQTDKKNIKAVYSHPQALAQSRRWLNQHLPNVERVETASTAQAAARAAASDDAAAVAGKLAAERFNLNVLAARIEDRGENYTRFVVIGRELAKKARRNKTSIMFSVKDEPGSLFKVLQVFARKKVNMTKIQSRPLPHRPWEYLFFLDCEGHVEEAAVAKMMSAIKQHCLFLKILGSYPRKV